MEGKRKDEADEEGYKEEVMGGVTQRDTGKGRYYDGWTL